MRFHEQAKARFKEIHWEKIKGLNQLTFESKIPELEQIIKQIRQDAYNRGFASGMKYSCEKLNLTRNQIDKLFDK